MTVSAYLEHKPQPHCIIFRFCSYFRRTLYSYPNMIVEFPRLNKLNCCFSNFLSSLSAANLDFTHRREKYGISLYYVGKTKPLSSPNFKRIRPSQFVFDKNEDLLIFIWEDEKMSAVDVPRWRLLSSTYLSHQKHLPAFLIHDITKFFSFSQKVSDNMKNVWHFRKTESKDRSLHI